MVWYVRRHRAVHEPVEPFRAGVSPRVEASAHDCGSGGVRGDPVCASGGGVAVSPQVDVELT